MNVIILAQGQQQRMVGLSIPKQLIVLPHVETPLLERTIVQVRVLAPDAHVTVVCAGAVREYVEILIREGRANIGWWELGDPGNSSLKGAAAYMRGVNAAVAMHLGTTPDRLPSGRSLWPDLLCQQKGDRRTVVLLGDVVYSWHALQTMLSSDHECDGADHEVIAEPWRPGWGFAGSSDLSQSGGELWGLWWTPTAVDLMMTALHNALAEHPPFNDYQPGQMRRWLWAIDDLLEFRGSARDQRRLLPRDEPWYVRVDDYTRDFDIPEHLKHLDATGLAAAADDREQR